jgi:uncharacterized membrane protein
MSNEGGTRAQNILLVLCAFLAVIGLFDSIYLSMKHLSGEMVPCGITTGCEEVLTSSYSTMLGVPLPYMGVAAYFTAFSLSILGIYGYALAGKLLLPLAAIMAFFSSWLLFVQSGVLHKFCQFCLLSAATSLMLFAVIFVRKVLARKAMR